MWIKNSKGLRWHNLDAMAEVAIREWVDGSWELVVREPGDPVPKKVLTDIPPEDVEDVRKALATYLMGIEAEELRPRKFRAKADGSRKEA
jgi:hypothetical protein